MPDVADTYTEERNTCSAAQADALRADGECRGNAGVPIAAGILYPVFGILLSPMVAAAAMSFSSVSVITNALRLRKAKI